MKKETADLIQEIARQLAALGELDASMMEYVERHKPFYASDELTRDMVKALIEEIKVYSTDTIEIVWAYAECYQELRGLLSA